MPEVKLSFIARVLCWLRIVRQEPFHHGVCVSLFKVTAIVQEVFQKLEIAACGVILAVMRDYQIVPTEHF